MVKGARICISLVPVLLLLAPLPGCGDDDEREVEQKPVDGTFVGKVSGTDALVAVVASPAASGKDKREAQIYVSDGNGLSESFAGSVERNSFTARSGDEGAETSGELAGESVKGTVELPDGKSARYEARRATGASGLYELTVSRKGTLGGASAAGVGVTSKSKLEVPGKGMLKLADGKRRKFEVTAASGGEPGPLRSGQVRLIVLPDGRMSGAGARGPGAGDGETEFFVKSLK
jgi:hypothetical protein